MNAYEISVDTWNHMALEVEYASNNSIMKKSKMKVV